MDMMQKQSQGKAKRSFEDVLKDVSDRIERVASNGVDVSSARMILVDASAKKSWSLAFRAQAACDRAECAFNLGRIEAELATVEVSSADAIRAAIAAARKILNTAEPTHKNWETERRLRREYQDRLRALNMEFRRLHTRLVFGNEVVELISEMQELIASDSRLEDEFKARFQQLTGPVDENNLDALRNRHNELSALKARIERREDELDTTDRLARAGISLTLARGRRVA